MNSRHLPVGVVEAVVRADHVMSASSLVVDRQLCGDALPGVGLGESIARHQPPQLHLGAACHNDDEIEVRVSTHLVEQWNIGDGVLVTARVKADEPLVDPPAHLRVHDGFQCPPGISVGEHSFCHLLPVEPSALAQHLTTEARNEGG